MNLDAVNSTGTREVDGSTVYRLGSVTKIFTVLTWLAEVGDEHWFVPITNFVPELRDIQERSRGEGDAIRYTDWDAVTVGALASQMSGIPRDCKSIEAGVRFHRHAGVNYRLTWQGNRFALGRTDAGLWPGLGLCGFPSSRETTRDA